MSGIETRGLIKRYPRSADLLALLRRPFARETVTALRGVDVRLVAGRIYGLVGPNGAGKTTLLKILAGLVMPTEGEVLLDGERVSGRSPSVRRRVGLVVADERSFFWRLSARENLRFFATLQGIERAALRSSVREVLAKVELDGFAERRFEALSTGMRQRLAIARGLLGDPSYLLMDEATRSLDPRSAHGVRTLTRRLVEEDPSRLVVYSSHRLDEVRDVCDEVIVLAKGRVVAVRTAGSSLATGPVRYEVRTRTPLDAAALAGLEGVSVLAAAPLRCSVRLSRPEAIDAVLARLLERGVGLASLEPQDLLDELEGSDGGDA